MDVTGEQRRRLLLESAASYFQAAGINGTVYPLINAATLSLLAGERNKSEELARNILARNNDRAYDTETPYWCAATRAEALLLLGNIGAAEKKLIEAIQLAPRAYEDHASTLAQFERILEVLEKDTTWLDRCRPPKCMHFAGHLAIAVSDAKAIEAIRKIVAEERIGFGYGALAAGSDLIIADALLAAGAELHLVLPNDAQVFCRLSVESAGEEWVRRFNRILKDADSILTVDVNLESTSTAALQLATEAAMGSAIMKAGALMTSATQLVISDGEAPQDAVPGSSYWASSIWRSTGRKQCILTIPRSDRVIGSPMQQSLGFEISRVAAMLRIECSDPDKDILAREVLPALSKVVVRSGVEPISVSCTRECLNLACRTPVESARIALELIEEIGRNIELRIAGHYGVCMEIADPFHHTNLLGGDAVDVPSAVIQSVLPVAFCVTECFASALYVDPSARSWRTEYVGELPPDEETEPVPLYSVQMLSSR